MNGQPLVFGWPIVSAETARGLWEHKREKVGNPAEKLSTRRKRRPKMKRTRAAWWGWRTLFELFIVKKRDIRSKTRRDTVAVRAL